MNRNRQFVRGNNPKNNAKNKKPPPPPPPTPALIPIEDTPSCKEYLRSAGELGLSWSKVLHVMIPGTLVYSPFFVRPLMTMASFGTRGNTADEISDAVRIPRSVPAEGADFTFRSFCQTQENIRTYFTKFHDENVKCHFLESRSFWIKKGFEISAPFLEQFTALFPTATFQELEFYDSVAASARLNAWLSKETDHHIGPVIKERDLNEFTRIVLLHGIYFCGNWKAPFAVQNTVPGKFKLNLKRRIEVPMMNRTGKFLYGEFPAIDAVAVAIPFHKEALYLVIILPKSGTNLDKLRIRGIPHPVFKVMKEKLLSVALPRFTIQSQLHLIPLLHHIGVKSMFDPMSADFSGITGYIPGGSGLFVSEVIQVVKIEVNEGQNIAPPPAPPQQPAKTGQRSKSLDKGGPPKRSSSARGRSPRRGKSGRSRSGSGRGGSGGAGGSTKPFVVDHPFIFQVIDKKTNTLLIDGTCMDPSAVPP